MLKLKMTGLIIFACIMQSFSQTSVWYFGTNAGLKFNSNSTTSPQTGSAMVTNEGCTSATDNNGNLFFYGDGKSLWHGGNNSLLTSAMLGTSSSTQSAIVVPLPGNACTKFLVFTTEGVETTPTTPNGLGVSLVTVTGSAPTHTVAISPAVSVVSGQAFAEKLSVTSDGNGGWWLVAHDFSMTTTGGTAFYKYHITNTAAFINAATSTDIKTALNNNVTTQVIGSAHNGQQYNAQGQMKFTKDGTKLGLVLAGSKKAETFLFNLTTGLLTLDKSISVTGNNTYGFEFSPGGTRIFVAQAFGNGGTTSNLYQYDISVATPTQHTVASAAIPNGATGAARYPFNGMQIGPDNKIYVCGPLTGNGTLSIINNPDTYGVGANYSASSVAISGTTTHNLPTVIAAQVSCDTPANGGCNCSGVTASLSSLALTSSAGSATASFMLNSGGNNIKKIRITLLNYIVTPNNASCKNYCSMTNSDFGKFVMPSGTLTGFASMFSPFQPMSSPSATSDVELTTSAPRVINNESISFNLKFPPILALSCCTQTVSACFRIEFIDADCRICDVVICNTQGPVPASPSSPTSTRMEEGNTMNSDSERNNDPHVKVYPNPNNGSFVINTSEIGPDCKFQVMSLEGREIQSGEIRGESHEINNTNLLPGTYSVFVFKENQVFTEKIVVMRD